VLDDLTPLRRATPALLEQEAALLPVKPALMFISAANPARLPPARVSGGGVLHGPQPPFGAVFTYYLKEEMQTLKKARQAAEKKIADKAATWAIRAGRRSRRRTARRAPPCC